MAITQQQIDALIQFIDDTEDPLSVTNVIVSAILLFLNNKIKGMEETVATAAALDEEVTARQEGDATLQQNIDTLSSRITNEILSRQTGDEALQQSISLLGSRLDALVSGDTTTAIESFNEVINFLAGVNDDETLTGKLLELKNQVDEASNKTDKDPVTGKLAYSQAPSVVLASMGQGYDDPQMQYAPHAGDFYYSGGIIYYYRSNNSPVSLGEPIQGLVYCNQSTDDLYRWTGSQWRPCGNNGIDSQTYEAIKTNVNSVAAKVDELIQDLAPLAYLSSNTHNQLGPLTWPDTQPMLISPIQGSTINIGTLASNETQKSATVHIEGRNLTQQVRVMVAGTGFSVSSSTLTASQVNAGIDINVTYSDSSPGDGSTKTCSISISSQEVSRTVTVTASKAAETPVNPPVSRTVTFALTGLSMTQNGASIANSSVSDGGTFEGTLIVNDSASYDLPDSVTVDGSHGTVSYNNSTGAISIPNITSNITITASAKAKQQSQALRVVRGWAFTEDYTIKADEFSNSSDNHLWTFPRKPFYNDTISVANALNGHGKATGKTNGLTGMSNGTFVCYTDYIRIPTNANATGIYYGHVLQRAGVEQSSNRFAPYIKFYKKEGDTMVPILVKSMAEATSRLLGSSDLGNVLTLIQNGTKEVYARASFLMSDSSTVNTSCCLKFNNANGDTIWSAGDPTNFPYTVVSTPIDNDGDTYANYSSSDGTMTSTSVYEILKAGKTVAS